METKKKKKINEDKIGDKSKKKLSGILLKKNHIENYINFALNEKEDNLNKQGKKNNLSKSQVDSNAIETQLKKLIEHLHSLKFKLEEEKKKDKKKKHHIFHDKNKDKEKEESIENFKNLINLKKECHEIPKRNFSSSKLVNLNNKRDNSIVNCIPQLIKTIEVYKNKNVEEQKNKKHIIEKYESILRNVKTQHINEISEIKNNILQDVDFLIQKYRKIALDLLEITKKKEKEKKEEQKKITEICINACKKFEGDVKNKAKISMQEYKTYMLQLVNDIKREKENLEKKIVELKKKMEEEKYENEKKVFDAYESKIIEEREINKELKNKLTLEKEENNSLLNNLYTNVDSQIKIYEEKIVKTFHSILIKNNVNMSVRELCNCIKDAMEEKYKDSHVYNDVKIQEKEEKLKIKYGFASVFDK